MLPLTKRRLMPWLIALAIFAAFNFVLIGGSVYYFQIDAWFAYVYHWDWHHGYPDWHPDPFVPKEPPPLPPGIRRIP